ncbi:MAG: DUF2218 domain-containing protein [Rhodospirillales bacterium]|nr:DUF2218 domain-containing protein [Rhodospirillales bacterium]
MDALFPAHAEARFATPMARRYLGQLCKHFAHRLPVTQGESEGRIAFPSGHCIARAEAEALVLHLDAPDAATLGTLQDVVERHLLRFAFREAAPLAWAAAPA